MFEGLEKKFKKEDDNIEKLMKLNEKNTEWFNLTLECYNLTDSTNRHYMIYVPVVCMQIRDIIRENSEDICEIHSEVRKAINNNDDEEYFKKMGILEEFLNDFREEKSLIESELGYASKIKEYKKRAEKSIDSHIFVKNYSDAFTDSVISSSDLMYCLTALRASNLRETSEGELKYDFETESIHIMQDYCLIAKTNNGIDYNCDVMTFIYHANKYINDDFYKKEGL